MKRKVGKKQSKKMRVPEPSSYFIGSEGTKTEVIYFQGLARKLKEKYKGLEERVVVPSLTIQGMGTSNKRLLLDIEEYLTVFSAEFSHFNEVSGESNAVALRVASDHSKRKIF